MHPLYPAEVFEPVPDADTAFSCPHRVLWVAPDEDLLVAIGIRKMLKRPEVHSLQDVIDLLTDGRLQRVEVKLRPYLFLAEEAIQRRSLDIRDRA